MWPSRYEWVVEAPTVADRLVPSVFRVAKEHAQQMTLWANVRTQTRESDNSFFVVEASSMEASENGYTFAVMKLSADRRELVDQLWIVEIKGLCAYLSPWKSSN
jgi:hypothetical protein